MEKKLKKVRSGTRIYDDKGFRLRVDCVCFKDTSKEEVLLVSSRSEDVWTIPGGGLEPNESDPVAALREAKEEAGVIGAIDSCLATIYDNERMTRTVAFGIIVSELDSSWLDKFDNSFGQNGRKRKWFTVDEAVKILIKRGKHLAKLQYFHCTDSSIIPTHSDSVTSTQMYRSDLIPVNEINGASLCKYND